MSHAAHFLRRLDRVRDADVELALTLYRDSELLREVLSAAKVAEGAERVAISLGDPVAGPFVVVTRDGSFVTCLGPGMRASNLPVVTRDRLEVASSRVQRMREELGRVRELRESGAEGEAGRVLRRMQQCGPHFAREDAEVLLRVRPLVAGELQRVTSELVVASREHFEPVAKLRFDRLSDVQREYLLAFGDLVWGVTHTSVIALGPDEPDDELLDESAFLWAQLQFLWGTIAHSQRALWLVAQRPRALLPRVKRMALAQKMRPMCVFREAALATIACASQKSRAEATKAMGRGGADAGLSDLAREMSRIMIDLPLGQPEEAVGSLSEHGRAYAAAAWKLSSGGREAEPAEVPADVALALWASLPLSWLTSDGVELAWLLCAAPPWLARASAAELFLPRQWLSRVVPERSVEDVIHWLRPAAGELGVQRVATQQRASPKVGRNDPCACGSGRKHKHCCARAAS